MQKIRAVISGKTISSNSSEAFSLYEKSRFGEPSGEKIQYMPSEAIFLFEKKKAELYDSGDEKLSREEALGRMKRIDKKMHVKYPVFRDLREKGHVVKTALKFGAEFRVYEKGSRPGKGHAKWIVFTDGESGKLTWHEFSAKNRVAHSTKKKLLLAIVDNENDVTYYEVSWLRI